MLIYQKEHNTLSEDDNPISLACDAIIPIIASARLFVHEHSSTANNKIIENNFKRVFENAANLLQTHMHGVYSSCINHIEDVTCSQDNFIYNSLNVFCKCVEDLDTAKNYALSCECGNTQMIISVNAPQFNSNAYEMEMSLNEFPHLIVKYNGEQSSTMALYEDMHKVYSSHAMSEFIELLLVPVRKILEMIEQTIGTVKEVHTKKRKDFAHKCLVKVYEKYKKSELMIDTKIEIKSYGSMDFSSLLEMKDKIVKLCDKNYVFKTCVSSNGEFSEDGALAIYKNEKTTEDALNECFHLMLCRRELTNRINAEIAKQKNMDPKKMLLFLPEESRNIETLTFWIDNLRDEIFYKCNGKVTVDLASAYIIYVFFEKLNLDRIPKFKHGAGTAYYEIFKMTGCVDWVNANHIQGYLNKLSGLSRQEVKCKHEKIWLIACETFGLADISD